RRLRDINVKHNKFRGPTNIVVTSVNGLQFSNQTLDTVQENSLVHQTAERLEWGGRIGSDTSGTPLFLTGINPTNDFDYATFNITGTRLFSYSEAVVDNIIAEKLGSNVGSTLNITTFTSNFCQNRSCSR